MLVNSNNNNRNNNNTSSSARKRDSKRNGESGPKKVKQEKPILKALKSCWNQMHDMLAPLTEAQKSKASEFVKLVDNPKFG